MQITIKTFRQVLYRLVKLNVGVKSGRGEGYGFPLQAEVILPRKNQSPDFVA